jgi:hemolysin III
MEKEGTLEARPSVGEEIANAVTHGLGVLLSIAALVLLVALAAMRGDAWHVVSYAIFGASLIALYSMSTMYHSLSRTKVVRLFEVLDHSCIFTLIAGTYTAFTLPYLRDSGGWWLFGLEWGIAAAGIAFKAIFMEKWKKLSLLLYIIMGWLIAPFLGELQSRLGEASFYLLAAGGAAYTVGAAFYAAKRVKWMHSIWHLFVMGGSTCHALAAMFALP